MLRIYNTLTRNIEEFRPMKDGHVNMFVCGPTVYDFIHAGNARTFVIFDVVAKYLRYRGYKVNYIQNITDIDDKIIKRAEESGEISSQLAQKYLKEFMADIKTLNISAVNQYILATDHIGDIIRQIETLIANGYAYTISDGIYFDLSKFPEYGKLSGRTSVLEDDAVSRIDENPEKRNAGDFVLWKKSKDGAAPSGRASPEGREPSWPAPWFDGRPGWHIEDTAITESIFGPQYDLHGGGRDLMFPHHEAEITQQESASGLKPFVRYWMHTGFLENKSQRMGKSLGNFTTARNLAKEYPPEVLRLFFLSSHYRAPLDFSDLSLVQAEAGVQRITEFTERLRLAEEHAPFSNKCEAEVITAIRNIQSYIHASMDEDFNTPQAIAGLFDLIRLGNQYLDENKLDLECAGHLLEIFDFFHSVLGIIPMHHNLPPEKIADLVRQRQASRDKKDYSASDILREQIISLGWQVDDTPYGPRIKKI